MTKFQKLLDKSNKDNRTPLSVSNVNMEELCHMLEKYPLNVPIPSKTIREHKPEAWRLLLGIKGVYQLPTIELIDFLRHFIKGKEAIEVCCGNGTIGNSLGIPVSDRKLSEGTGNGHADKLLQDAQDPYNRHPYDFPEFVENLTAHQAIEKYSPETVIGCWVTEKARGRKLGSGYGVEEDRILEKGIEYVHCGSSANPLHTQKHIRKHRHWTIEADWLYDRGSMRGPSQLKIWCKEEPDWDAFPENLEFDIL